jgi:NADPH2:quinone reductase
VILFDLLTEQKIKPLIAQRFPLVEARQAQEILGAGGVAGKIVLICNEAEKVPRGISGCA